MTNEILPANQGILDELKGKKLSVEEHHKEFYKWQEEVARTNTFLSTEQLKVRGIGSETLLLLIVNELRQINMNLANLQTIHVNVR